MSLVLGTVDSDVASECHLSCPPLYLQRRCPPWTAVRTLCLKTELEKRKKEKWPLSLSAPLFKGDRVGTGLRGLQGVWCVVQVCFKGCYVCENVGECSVKPCLVDFFASGKSCGGV